MRILFLGDVVGIAGCSKIANNLLDQVKVNKIDFVIVNGENAAEAGVGITKEICEDFFRSGVNVITTGNHIWDQKDIMNFINDENRLLRPKNLFEPAPGNGFEIFKTGGAKIGVLNLMGTVFMKKCEDVFEAAEKFNVWAYHVMGDSSKLDGRHREILILRVGWLCDSEYEWGQHKIFAKNEGLSEEEIERVKIGSKADDWSDIERALLDAVDELHENSFISDHTWGVLSRHYTEQQMMDVVFTVGQYHMVSMALNSFGVQLDEGITGF